MTEVNVALVTWQQSWVRGKGRKLGEHLALSGKVAATLTHVRTGCIV
jgi:hypothetical protein